VKGPKIPVQSKLDQVLNEAAIAVSDQHRGTILREWDRLAGPGPTLTGEQRVRIAAAARRACKLGAPPPEANPLIEAVAWIRCDPGGITDPFVDELSRRGLDRLMLAEVIGVVSRLAAIDSFSTGVGAEHIPLPTPFSGEPTSRIHRKAAMHVSWVPTIRKQVGPLGALRALPTEQDAIIDIHDNLYLSRHQMRTNTFDHVLTRPQLELVAGRCGFLNECEHVMVTHAQMLRRSCRSDPRLNLLSITALDPVDAGIEDGLALIALTDAVHAESPQLLEVARQGLAHQGDDAVREAIAVAANFQMMCRVLSATGLSATDLHPRIREQLGYNPNDGETLAQDPQSIDTQTHPAAAGSARQIPMVRISASG